MVTRFIKTVNLYYSDMENADAFVNDIIKQIRDKGGKIVNINNITFGISPALMVYTIVYEAENEIETKGRVLKTSKR